jgi:hypothetical protein
MNNYLKAAYITIFISIMCVIVTRLIAPSMIDDYHNFNDMGALALLTLIFFVLYGLVNSVLFPTIYYFNTPTENIKGTNFIYLFLVCLTTSTILVFLGDWLYNIVIESDTSSYYANLLITSLEESDPDQEFFDLLLKSPFLTQNYVVNFVSILLSWSICIPVLRHYLKQKIKNNNVS